MFIKQKEKESKETTLPLPLSPKTVSALKNKNVPSYSSIAKFRLKTKFILKKLSKSDISLYFKDYIDHYFILRSCWFPFEFMDSFL